MCVMSCEYLRCGVRAHQLHGLFGWQGVERDGCIQLGLLRRLHSGHLLLGFDLLKLSRRQVLPCLRYGLLKLRSGELRWIEREVELLPVQRGYLLLVIGID